MLTSLTQLQRVMLAVAIGALLLGTLMIVRGRGDRAQSERGRVSYEPPTPESPEIKVHVTGEVARPGVYELPLGARVENAVRAAGGFKAGARESSVNLAGFLEDGEQIFVEAEPPAEEPAAEATGKEPEEQSGGATVRPSREPTAGAGHPSGSLEPAAAKPGRIRLNSAGLEELQELPGVGPETARLILYYRHEHGKFRSFEELAKIKGIGPKTIEKIRVAATLN